MSAAPKTPDTRTLKEALDHAYRERWAGTRSEKTTMCQATIAANHAAYGVVAKQGEVLITPATDFLALAEVQEVSPSMLREATARWYREGISPATINKRLNCLSTMGISVEGCRVKNPKKLQWWLRPEVEEKVVQWIKVRKPFAYAAFILWTTKTGLRIEESLRLRWSDFSEDCREVTVPGMKTGEAQATLAIGEDAANLIAGGRSLFEGPNHQLVFGFTYEQVHEVWQEVRKEFGFTDPTATLKALRRSAARYLHYDRGMPLDMVRQYLRHENIETTMGYLRLTGGVSLDEQRRYLG